MTGLLKKQTDGQMDGCVEKDRNYVVPLWGDTSCKEVQWVIRL